VVVAGIMAIEIDGTTHQMQTGDTVIIGPGVVHAIKNQGLKFISYVIGSGCGGPGDKIPV
jgi:quercetin dioxygenase-like cupin family protein